MYYFRSLLFLITGCLIAKSLGDHRSSSQRCMESVRWNEILKEIEKLNMRSFPLECTDMDNKDLCVPEQMLKAVKHDKAAIVQIVHEIAELFKTAKVPFPHTNVFLKEMYATHEQLKTCLQSSLFNVIHESIVKDCFKRMSNYLIKSNSHCAWQEVHAQSREVLQRIETYAFKRKGTHQ
ncbi:unnamed protein product [Caretta caretta]